MLTFKFNEQFSAFNNVQEHTVKYIRSFPMMENANLVVRHFDLYNGEESQRSVFHNADRSPKIVFLFDTVRRRYLRCALSNGGSYHFVSLENIGAICGVGEGDRDVLGELLEMAKDACCSTSIHHIIENYGFKVTKKDNYLTW